MIDRQRTSEGASGFRRATPAGCAPWRACIAPLPRRTPPGGYRRANRLSCRFVIASIGKICRLIIFSACAVSSAPQPVRAEADSAPISIVRNEVAENKNEQVDTAYRAYQAGNLEAARSGYVEVLQAYPDNRDAMLGLAACAVREGDVKSALSMYQRIIRAFPQDVLSRAALIGLQRNRQGESVIREMLSKQPDNPFLYVTLGQLQAEQARWAEARQAFSAAHRLEPANPVYTLNLAISLDRMGLRDDALSYYRATLKLVEQGASDLDIRPVIRRIQSLRRP